MIPGLKKRVLNLYDVMMYVAIARKHARLMVLLITLSLTTGLTIFVYARPVYFSRAVVKIDVVPLPLSAEEVYEDANQRIHRTVRYVMQMLKTPTVMERTARKLGIKVKNDEITAKYVKRVQVVRLPDGNLEIRTWPYVHEWCERWPEEMVDSFLEFREERRINQQIATIESYEREMKDIMNRMEENLTDRATFEENHDVTELMIQARGLSDLPKRLVDVRKRLDEMARVRERLDGTGLDSVAKLSLISQAEEAAQVNVGDTVPSASPSRSGNEDGEQTSITGAAVPAPVVVVPSMVSSEQPWEKLEQERRRIRRDLREKSEVYLPEHRVMTQLQNELDTINRKLDLEYEVARGRYDLEYNHLQATRFELETKLPEYQKVNLDNDKVSQEYSMFSSGQLAWKRMYSQMSKKLQELDFADGKDRVSLRYIGVNYIRDLERPVSPNRIKLLGLSLLAGLVLAVAIPFLIEYLDHTVTSLEEIESTFQIRGLGIVPHVESGGTDLVSLIGDEGGRGHRNLLENFRVIRTNINQSGGEEAKPPQVVMVTSAIPKEGKTVISSNLALSFAQTGAKTLLIDADLRRGRLHRVFGMRKAPGLSGVLAGHGTIDEAIRKTGREGLYLISTGEHVNSGTELLSGPIFKEVMNELRSRFDRIVLDTPPVLGLSETSLLQRSADGVVFVVWSGRTPIKDMRTAVEMLHTSGATFLGTVLNRLDLSSTTNYYQYYYYSNEYYHSYHAIENA
jgi:capsular exopolysaccharide synthesis family protein